MEHWICLGDLCCSNGNEMPQDSLLNIYDDGKRTMSDEINGALSTT